MITSRNKKPNKPNKKISLDKIGINTRFSNNKDKKDKNKIVC